MIRFIYGSYGSGKTTEILNSIASDLLESKPSFLIVPDQEALHYERLTLSILPPASQLSLEILGFSRLYNRVCRKYGGLSYSYVTKPMRSLLMWKNLRELNGMLEDLNEKSINDPAMPDIMLGAINELKANGYTAAELELAANRLESESSLRARARDLALIYASFDNLVSEKYSDSSDDLMRLNDLLREHDFFRGANVYFDSFTSFTAVQHKIIKQIFKTADNVTVTVPLPSPDHSDISTLGIEASLTRLLSAAREYGNPETVVLDQCYSTSSKCLKYLNKNLWFMGADPQKAPDCDGSIVTEICDTPYSEAEAVTSHILELLRGGARCREITVIARDCEKYRGILDTALQKAEIPFYISGKSELCSMPPVKFILSALRIKKYNWQKNDVISHLKTGLCDISQRDANLFEEYVNTWNIHSDAFFDETWNMNPDGLVATVSKRGEEILAAANRVRKALVEPLLKLFTLLDAAKNVPDMCRAIYGYMVETSLEEKINELAKKAAKRSDLKQARELAGIYEVILNSLADVAQALEDETADTEEFIMILKSLFDKAEIGTIPTSIDQVTVGSASMLRASSPKYVFVIGLCEGEFPAPVKDSGIFSSIDRERLKGIGIELLGNDEVHSSDELMFVSRAFASAGERLFLFTHSKEIDGTTRFPSLAFNRVTTLFPKQTPHIYKMSDLDYSIGAPKNAASLLRSLEDGTSKESLREALKERLPEVAHLSSISPSADKCNVSKQTVSEALGNDLRLSSSSFEKYAKCPFDYYCSKVLKLREAAVSNFKANDIGSFVHYILEVLIKAAIPDDTNEPMLSDEEIVKQTEAAVEAYLERICPPSLRRSARLRHLYLRLTTLSRLLIRNTVKEFTNSQFRPAFFELKTNGRDANPAPLVFTLDDGCKVTFSGIIDRVDLYKNGKDVYIRVVDYKTGAKEFSLDDIEHGINLQMLLYLFTLCRNPSPEFKRSIGLEGEKEALPAGVIYLSTAIPTIEADDFSSLSQTMQNAENKLSRSGLLLNDRDVLTAMNSELDSKFLAGIKSDKDGEIEGKALTSAEGFADIYKRLEDTVKRIAGELHSGRADASPLVYKAQSPCDYCSSKAICRKNNK